MTKERSAEKSINTFLEKFLNAMYNDNKILFNNIQYIYILITTIAYNMKELQIESQNLISTTRKDYAGKLKLINNFYKSIDIDFEFNKLLKDKTFYIIKTNNPENATYDELTYGEIVCVYDDNKNVIENKINVYDNNLLADSIIWVHEISHYKNQPPEKRREVNGILTELIAFTEELIYTDYLSQMGYEEEARTFMIKEYKNFTYCIKKSYFMIKIVLLYLKTKKISKKNYKLLYKDDKDYEYFLKIFNIEILNDEEMLFYLLHYSVGIISFYNYIEYKKDPNFLDKLKKLNKEIMSDISLEKALKIIDIELNQESLNKILENINIFRDSLIKENKKKRILN